MTIQTEVAPGVHRGEDAHTNFYVVQDGDRLTVVDACTPASWATLRALLDAIGRRLDDVAALVLTHAHYDHVGFAERARKELGVPVWVHEDDVPLARHPMLYGRERSLVNYLPNPRFWPIVAGFLRTRAFFAEGVKEPRRFENGSLDVPGRPQVVPTPGHTLGHCCLHFADRNTLIAGDAIVMLDPYTVRPGPRLVARAATADVERNMRSLDAIAETGAQTVLTGHGDPWTGGAEAAAEKARVADVG